MDGDKLTGRFSFLRDPIPVAPDHANITSRIQPLLFSPVTCWIKRKLAQNKRNTILSCACKQNFCEISVYSSVITSRQR
ncbi:hypothetical protein PAHAL_6G216700 [Panicum hallii]|uniref:Uncharacterized protein n=1 Tax=Panicum hallii TaxID=206008 RepID=A0A2T8IH31_9POAL|nr:hypothetical protein PAHAL_6G216700 [Panicum hallii]